MTDPLQLEITRREKLSYARTRLHIQPTFKAMLIVMDSDLIDIEKMTVDQMRYRWGRTIVNPIINQLHVLYDELRTLSFCTEDRAQRQSIERRVEKILSDLNDLANGDLND